MTLVNEIAQEIRRVDGGNKLSAHELGLALIFLLGPRPYRVDSSELIRFLKRVNRDKKLGAGRLAELIIEEFGLEEVA